MRKDPWQVDPRNCPDSVRGILLYGSNALLVEYLLREFSENFSLKRFAEGDFLANYGVFLSPDLFSTGSIVCGIQDVTDKNLKIYVNLLSQPHVRHYFLILTSLQLRSASPLVKFFTKESFLWSVPCYELSCDQKVPFVRRSANRLGVKCSESGLRLLANTSSFSDITSVLTQLSLYQGPGTTVREEDVRNFLSDEEQSVQDLVFSLSDHKWPGGWSLPPLRDPIYVIRQIFRHFLQLFQIRLGLDNGKNLQEAIAQIHPAVFFKQEALLKLHVLKWDKKQILRALELICNAEIAAKEAQNAIWNQYILEITSL